MVQRKFCARVWAREQVTHVVADPRETLETGLVIEKALNLLCAHPLLAHEIKHNSRIELARPRPHRQAVKRRKAQRALHALASRHGAHGGAAAEMSDDDSPRSDFGRYLGKSSRDVFVREAMEAIAANSLRVELLGERIAVGNFRMVSMKGRVETGDLQQLVLPSSDGTDRCQIVRLVERGKRRKFLEPLNYGVIDHRCVASVCASMDYA